jgi:class 3 adenylate cyclase
VTATLHIGNLTNNYFSDRIVENLGVFADGAGTIVENSVLFVRIRELESRIRHVFSKFVPAEVINDLLTRGSDEALMVGEKRDIVVLFSDIRSFTAISENNKAEDVVSFLNKHFSVMVEVIKRHGGSIDKFIGDAIFAIFGAPVSYEDNAMRAVQAAVDMIQAMDQVETGFLKLPAAGYAIGIGVHEGPAIVGNIGSSDKFDYTAIGDTVNIASRLEGLTKHYHRKILVSEEIAGKTGSRFDLREVDRVKVKGKLKATSLFAVEDVEDALPPEARMQFDKGIKLYKQGNWETALDYFNSVRQGGLEDPISDAFIERCRAFLVSPPEAWDGAVALDFK